MTYEEEVEKIKKDAASARKASTLALWSSSIGVVANFVGLLLRRPSVALVIFPVAVGLALFIVVSSQRLGSVPLQVYSRIFSGMVCFVLGSLLIACMLFKPGYW